jgi:hypothetical protein
MKRISRVRRGQRGWAGIVMLLLALVVVGFVVRAALKQMGLADQPAAGAVAGHPPTASRGSPTPAAATAIERARGLQDEVLKQGVRTDEQLKAVER